MKQELREFNEFLNEGWNCKK